MKFFILIINTCIFCLITNSCSTSKETITSDSDSNYDSYIFVADLSSPDVYLINHEGDKLFKWNLAGDKLGNDANLMDDGSVIVSLQAQESDIKFGGYGGIIRKINSDQSIEWQISYYGDGYCQHHDVEYLSNGNILFPVCEKVPIAEAKEMGFSGRSDIYLDAIIEMNPLTKKVVWEWHSKDHLVQNYDSSKNNYGVISDNPNKININYPNKDEGDITHFNGLTLDEENDLIYVTALGFKEVWVVDHSTSPKLGGDLVYRFGNPLAYDNDYGTITLANVHCPNLLDNGDLLVFANNYERGHSAVYEYKINPPYSLKANQDNEPKIVWEFKDDDLFSLSISGADRMSNGNTLIAEGTGTLWEVSSSGEVLWQNNDFQTPWRAYSVSSDSKILEYLGISTKN